MEKDHSYVLITIMLIFLFCTLIVYVLNIIDHWNDIKMILDTILIVITISFDFFEITTKANDKNYFDDTAIQVPLNFARLLRGLMLQRRASNFFAKLSDFYQSKQLKKQIKRRNSVTDMLNELMLYIGKDEKYLKKGINH